jgi:hypothetical protein
MKNGFFKTRLFLKTFKGCFVEAIKGARNCDYKNDEE